MDYYPIFAVLKNHAVLLVGGGTVAERKAHALIKAGATVRLVAEELSETFVVWKKEGKIQYLGPVFLPAYLDHVYLVVAATDDPLLNAAVFDAATKKRVFCNTVDDLQHCSFIVPAVVDRSPVQVAISSGGFSPVLVRSLKEKIEQLIPLHTGKLAQIAGKWRHLVKELIPSVKRRYFWEALFQSRFDFLVAQHKTTEAEYFLEDFLRNIKTQEIQTKGVVTLVGAGPGDPGLLTLHALQALNAADVVLYDALVSEGVLEWIRKDALKINVGKRARAHQIRQEKTNALLLAYAKKGFRVVRLKGGDPFVFGRGGEEAQLLAKHGIPFKIVPGITAGVGASAYAGIPLTHRDMAHSVVFVTGQAKGQAIDWADYAKPQQTVVVYMGVYHAAEIAHDLIQAGRAPDIPVAIISEGTTKTQKVAKGCLKDLPRLANDAVMPALLVIGEVVDMALDVAWFQPEESRLEGLDSDVFEEKYSA